MDAASRLAAERMLKQSREEVELWLTLAPGRIWQGKTRTGQKARIVSVDLDYQKVTWQSPNTDNVNTGFIRDFTCCFEPEPER